MLEVRVLCLGKGAIPIEKGRIYYDGKLHPSDNSYLLREILANEIYTDKGKKLRAEEDPEAFFRGLSGHYRSAYLRVTAPKEVPSQGTKSYPPVDEQETLPDELASKEKPDTQKVSQSSSEGDLDRRARLIADILGNTLIPAEIDQILDSEAKPKSST